MASFTVARPLSAGLGALALASSAFAADYTVSIPTAEPFYRNEVAVGPGAFLDTYSFTVPSAMDGYALVFPYIPNDLTALLVGTYLVQLKVYDSGNHLIGTGKTAAELGVDLYSDPARAAVATQLATQGYNPADALFIGGSLAAGTYTATISGIGAFLGGGYVAQFSIPSPVPEPGTLGLLAGGLSVVGGVALRRRARSARG